MKSIICLLCQMVLVSSALAQWTQLPDMPTSRDDFAGALIDGELYVFGGNTNPDHRNLGTGEKYSFASETWQPIATHPYYKDITFSAGVEEIYGVGLNGKFYVFGAWGDDPEDNYTSKNLNFNQVYDPATDTWTPLAEKPTRVTGASIAIYDEIIYVFGGHGEEGATTEVEAYDPSTNSWQLITHLPEQVARPAVAVYQDKAYIMGGIDFASLAMNTEVMVYDFALNEWLRNYTQMPTELIRAFGNASVYPVRNGKVYLVGGFVPTVSGDLSASNKATVFDITAKEWHNLEDLPEARTHHGAFVYENTLYVLGGYEIEDDANRSKKTLFAYLLDEHTAVQDSIQLYE